MSVDNTEDLAEALSHLLDLRLTNIAYATVRRIRTGVNGVAILGPAGTGKSTYAYNALKAAYLLTKCEYEGIRGTSDCAKYVLSKFDICLGRGCEEPDEIDEELREYVYVGDDDIPRLIKVGMEIAEQGERPLPFLFIDDILLKGTYQLGGKYKELMQLFRRTIQYRRALARLVIVTATSKKNLSDAVPFDDVVYVKAVEQFESYIFIRWMLMRVPFAMRDSNMKTYTTYRMIYQPEWKDVIPRKKVFGMPIWLEKLINRRKLAILKVSLERYERAAAKEERGDRK